MYAEIWYLASTTLVLVSVMVFVSPGTSNIAFPTVVGFELMEEATLADHCGTATGVLPTDRVPSATVFNGKCSVGAALHPESCTTLNGAANL